MNRYFLVGLIAGLLFGYWLASVRWTPPETPTRVKAVRPPIPLYEEKVS